VTDNVTVLHRIRCALCGFATNDIARYYGHRCHPSKRATPAGVSVTSTADRTRSPLRLVGSQPAEAPA
jgi:hypothetical protein